jgi:hypothetical protein
MPSSGGAWGVLKYWSEVSFVTELRGKLKETAESAGGGGHDKGN